MTDTCICPACRTELDVEIYGPNLRCSECGERIDVFMEPDVLVDTPVGTLGVKFPNGWKGLLKLGL